MQGLVTKSPERHLLIMSKNGNNLAQFKTAIRATRVGRNRHAVQKIEIKLIHSSKPTVKCPPGE